MGLLTKGLILSVGLIAFGSGAWIIALPIFAYLFLPPILHNRRPAPQGVSNTGDTGWKSRLPVVKVLGAVLLLLSLIGIAEGGTFSPIVFGVPGLILLAAPTLVSSLSSNAKPVEDSILLRGRFVPFKWYAIAEVKVSTRDVASALSGVGERILLVSGPAPRILLIFATSSFSRSGAEDSLFRGIKSAARALVPLGVYLLPLDSSEAETLTQLKSLQIGPHRDDIRQFISTSDYGAVAVEGLHGFVRSFELYAKSDETLKTRSVLSGAWEMSQGLPTVREFLHLALHKTGAPHPDGYTAFLSSMAATEGETLGQRITQTEGDQGEILFVASLGTPQVKLTRAQLQAATRIYE